MQVVCPQKFKSGRFLPLPIVHVRQLPSLAYYLSPLSLIFFNLHHDGHRHSAHLRCIVARRDYRCDVSEFLPRSSIHIHFILTILICTSFSGIVTAQTFAYFKFYTADSRGTKALVSKAFSMFANNGYNSTHVLVNRSRSFGFWIFVIRCSLARRFGII